MRIKKFLGYSLLFTACFLLDRITKCLILRTMEEGIEHICCGFNLVKSWNYGVSFGLAQAHSLGGYYLLCFIIIIVIMSLASYTCYRFFANKPIIGEVMVLAGALANMADRYEYGAVFDFIDLYICSWHWYTFNSADACIVIGMVIMMLIHIKEEYYA